MNVLFHKQFDCADKGRDEEWMTDKLKNVLEERTDGESGKKEKWAPVQDEIHKGK